MITFCFLRREAPWKIDGESTGVSSKLKLLEQELLNLERIGKTDLSKVPSSTRKQVKRYQALAGKIDDLCRRMVIMASLLLKILVDRFQSLLHACLGFSEIGQYGVSFLQRNRDQEIRITLPFLVKWITSCIYKIYLLDLLKEGNKLVLITCADSNI